MRVPIRIEVLFPQRAFSFFQAVVSVPVQAVLQQFDNVFVFCERAGCDAFFLVGEIFSEDLGDRRSGGHDFHLFSHPASLPIAVRNHRQVFNHCKSLACRMAR